MNNIELFKDYENSKLTTAEEYAIRHSDRTVPLSGLGEKDIDGIPICVRRDDKGELQVTFIDDSHLLAIGATRSGKTTGYVIPTLNVLLNKKNKPSIVISDPKQELYRCNAKKFENNGYRVLMLDFTNYMHSDCWNPLTKYYRAYKRYLEVESDVKAVETEGGLKNEFRGTVYDDRDELERAISEVRERYIDEVEKGITALGSAIIPNTNKKDPFWDDSARDLLKALLYGMLEDIDTGSITEENFSFATVMKIFDSFTDSDKSNYDGGYFTRRNIETSKAHQLARKCIIEQADSTRRCISSEFAAKMNKFRDTAVRRITCTNTFEIQELDDGAPTVIFVSYKDEESLHYEVISMFLSNLYTELIGVARKKGSILKRPFYFLLDEFGNLPEFNDFDKVISACAGRNIWFLLILQSYAQLNNIYGEETAEIIKDNLNVHVFFGTNNPDTKRQFSEECGKKTIISPTSALNGSGEAIEHFEKDTVSLVPVSTLTGLSPGECIVTQMRDDVLWSRFERSYTCPEFESDLADPDDRDIKLCFSDPK
ncbi:MAG: type IV secretory system conjugative DNA transfer family protein, partial [Clostridia bacterium]|nr:type IV secretory system conjugative DNA transfer family protein [Clostridia bacterium]